MQFWSGGKNWRCNLDINNISVDKHEWKRNLVDELKRVIPGCYLESTLEAQ